VTTEDGIDIGKQTEQLDARHYILFNVKENTAGDPDGIACCE
jgi:hypothetical protein